MVKEESNNEVLTWNGFKPYKPAKIDVFLAKVFPANISETTFLGLVTVFALVMSCRGRMKR
uniref:Uncharacterized protein n=1 Tax=Meloidogyne enterolobii TaxID=390850 RepID=A0A6V7X4Z4_MELEN|nr:unnamed protein product [Meloidogyne enterolobii]